MSKKAIEEKGEEAIGTDPIGTGVYVLETVHTDPSQGVTLAANDAYWDTPAVTPRCRSSTSPTPRRARWRSCRATCT